MKSNRKKRNVYINGLEADESSPSKQSQIKKDMSTMKILYN